MIQNERFRVKPRYLLINNTAHLGTTLLSICRRNAVDASFVVRHPSHSADPGYLKCPAS